MFDLENFVADCRAAVCNDPTHRNVHEIMLREFADPNAVVKAVGEPDAGGIFPIYRSDDLTIINIVWWPHMVLQPHNHQMWAVIGVYGGREDNVFWRRIRDDNTGRIEAAGARSLSTGDVCPMGRDIIHSVVNPIPKYTGAIHVYGGDFFAAERSEWDAEHLMERPYDVEAIRAMFSD